jgi:hypothetical protein
MFCAPALALYNPVTEAPMEPMELNDDQKKMLAWLERAGAVSPSQLLAQTMWPPKEAWGMLTQLAEMGWLVIRDDPDSPDGQLIIPMSKPSAAQQKK